MVARPLRQQRSTRRWRDVAAEERTPRRPRGKGVSLATLVADVAPEPTAPVSPPAQAVPPAAEPAPVAEPPSPSPSGSNGHHPAAAAPPAEPESSPAEPAPAPRRRAPARARTEPARSAEPARAARARQQPAGQAVTRSAPAGYDKATKPLQVFVEADQHWTLKDWCHLNRIDMRRIGSELVSTFNHAPDTWYQLMLLAEEQRVSLGELLAPYLEQALAGEEDPE